jgi:hypothetical protein
MLNEKFITSYINFINNNFNENEHSFFVIDGIEEEKIAIPHNKNVIKYISKGRRFIGIIKKIILVFQIPFLYLKLFLYCKNSTKIYLHGLFDIRTIFFFYIFKKFLKKAIWIMWGGDLYSYENRKSSIFYKLYYKIDDYVKGHFNGYITYMEGDYFLAEKWYKAKGKLYKSFAYPSNFYKSIEFIETEKSELHIQIGNSAANSNNHLEILDKLKIYKDRNIKLFCVLSYGGSKYIQKIIDYGKNIFNEKFIPITHFMEFGDYMKFLSNMDIAIFAHNRQQGVGNIISLLSLGKTIYLRDDVTTYKTLQELGIKIKSFNKFDNIDKFNEGTLENNIKIIKEEFSLKNLKNDWEIIFND